MTDDPALALLRLLAEEDGIAIHRATRRLGVSLSELQRMLTALGDDERYDGLGLVVAREDGERTRLWLTEKGRALCPRS
ncbi:MAG TPA: hypothetical protein VFO79_02125 [Xanthomonadales bacterium]|nr:hypothetical protein [Xanthomonadales bacterium]